MLRFRKSPVSFVSRRIRSSRLCKPDSELGGSSSNPLFTVWLGTRQLVFFGRFDSIHSRKLRSVRIRRKQKADRTRSFCLFVSSLSTSFVPRFVPFLFVLSFRFVFSFRSDLLFRFVPILSS